MNIKACSKCKQPKAFVLFYASKGSKDGIYSHCKECHKKMCKECHEKTKEQKYAKAKEYRKKNPEKIRELSKKWDQCNKEKRKLLSKNSAIRKRAKLTDSYIVNSLMGGAKENIPKELIEAKRIQLTIHRMLKNGDQ